ncbi:hypothetical protein diail_4486 [Diaporthe ilicicola]|nr:hypothetical protein diail_4486 [Diaporthe ilicicola]
MYVECLKPSIVRHKHPLVFIHGLAQTATNWLNTPDGREGWASYFLRQGYVVYLTDHPERGRSVWIPGSGDMAVLSTAAATSLFTAPEKVSPLPFPQASLHTQWPGTGLPGDAVFDSFFATQVQYQNNATRAFQMVNNSLVALADRIGAPHILVTHSQAGPFGWQLADARPELVAGIVALEPGAAPFEAWTGPPYAPGYAQAWPPLPYGVTALPLAYDPPLPDDDPDALVRQQYPPAGPNLAPCTLQAEPARKLVNVAKVQVLQMVGEASFQAVYSGCVASYLQQAGVDVEFARLEDRGIRGNGHFSFMEKNSIEVAEKVVVPFLEKVENFVDHYPRLGMALAPLTAALAEGLELAHSVGKPT